MGNIRKEYDIPQEWQIVQTFPSSWSASPEQDAALATVGDHDDKVVFDYLITKGMGLLNVRAAGGVNGILKRFREFAGLYFEAAQAFSKLQHESREWEDYFPWIVFRSRYLGHKIDWIDWAVAEYGENYNTFDINTIIVAFRARDTDD